MNQPLPMSEQLKNLERLQELDLRIDSLKKNKNALPSGLRALDSSLQRLNNELQSKNQQRAEVEKNQTQVKAALELNHERLSRAQGKLEAVHNAQEYQAATKEIDQLKKLDATLEEQLNKAAGDVEVLRSQTQKIEEEINQIQQQRQDQSATVASQESQVSSDINQLMTERVKFSGVLEARILAQYERIRTARGGLGTVPVVNGRCKGCNMVVPPQLSNEVQRGSTLHSCPSCHRLLHISSEMSQPSESASGA